MGDSPFIIVEVEGPRKVETNSLTQELNDFVGRLSAKGIAVKEIKITINNDIELV